MTEEWLEPWLLKEEEELYNNISADDEDEWNEYIDKGINKYFD